MTRIFEGAQLTSGAPHVMWTRVKGASVPNWTTLFSRRTAPYHRGAHKISPAKPSGVGHTHPPIPNPLSEVFFPREGPSTRKHTPTPHPRARPHLLPLHTMYIYASFFPPRLVPDRKSTTLLPVITCHNKSTRQRQNQNHLGPVLPIMTRQVHLKKD